MAVNTPIQGTAADIIKLAMIAVAKKIHDKDVKMLVQVHDELIFEVKKAKLKIIAKEIKKTMEEVIKLKIPIIADVKYGDNWGEMKTILK